MANDARVETSKDPKTKSSNEPKQRRIGVVDRPSDGKKKHIIVTFSYGKPLHRTTTTN